MTARENSTVAETRHHNLCTGCGCCAGICPQHSITLQKDRYGIHLEPIIEEKTCLQCGLCISVCPGTGWDAGIRFPGTSDGKSVRHLGTVTGCFMGISLDDTIRSNAASGGIVAELLVYLLEKKYVDGVIVSRMKPGSALETETFIAKTRQEIISSQKSVYCPVPAGKILSEIIRQDGKYAFVGLPCHIAGLKKAQMMNEVLTERIIYTIGLFCSRTPTYRATENLLKNIGVRKEDLHAIEYRGRGHPGKLRVVLKDGSEKLVDHLDPRYWGYTFQYFYKPVRCWLCHDHSAMLADVSCGDSWIHKSPVLQDGRGTSIIVVRTPFMMEHLSQMEKEKRICLDTLQEKEVADSQNLYEKSDIRPRIRIMRLLKRAVPDNKPVLRGKESVLAIIPASLELINIRISDARVFPDIIQPYINVSYAFHRVLHNTVWKNLKRKTRRLWNAGKRYIGFLRVERMKPANPGKDRVKVIVMGGFGWKDIGDEAMPYCFIRNLRNKIPDLEILMLSPHPDQTMHYHHENAIQDPGFLSCGRNAKISRKIKVFLTTSLFLTGACLQRHGLCLKLWPGARRILDEMDRAALLFNNGGGNLNSIIPSELYKKCTLYWTAWILKKPVILSGQTIGPFYYRLDRWYAGFCLNHVDFISFRDKDVSQDCVRQIGVTRPFMIDAADDAMTLPKISSERALELLKSEAPEIWMNSGKQRCVVMNFKGSMSLFQAEHETMEENSVIQTVAHMSDFLIETFGVRIFYLPTDYSDGVDDRVFHRRIVQHMHCREDVFCIEKEYDAGCLKGLISLADYAIGSRYHFCVFAASEKIPFFGMATGVYQKTKLKGLADLCGTPQGFFANDISRENSELLRESLVQFFNDIDIIRSTLSSNIPVLMEKSLAGVKKAEEIIGKTITENNGGSPVSIEDRS